MDISLRAMNYFLTAVERGSIKAASDELHVVPSAVLAGVNQVEDAFGLKLTTRYRSKGITLTATGQLLRPKLLHLMEEYRALLKEGADLRGRLTGTLRIGYYAPIAPAFMPTILEGILEPDGDVDVKLFDCDNQEAQDGLIAGAYDVIICFTESMRTGVSYETLAVLPAYLLVSENHPLAANRTVSTQDVANERLVLLELPNISEYYREIFEDASISPQVAATATSVEMVRSLVAAGVGCSLLNMWPLNDRAYNGKRLRALPIETPIPPLSIAIGHFADNPRRVVRAFVERCLEYFESDELQRMIVK